MLYVLKTIPNGSFQFGSSIYKLCIALRHPCIKSKRSHTFENSLYLKKFNSNGQYNIKQQRCGFHKTQRLCISPIIVISLKCVLLCTPIFGMVIKTWWRKQSQEQCKKYKEWFRKRRHIFFGFLGFCSLILFYYYITHIEVHPLTQRSRFLIFNRKEEAQCGEFLRKQLILLLGYSPHSHPIQRKLEHTVQRILKANQDWMTDQPKKWTTAVIESPIPNISILPGGHIMFNEGMLKYIANGDQLAILLSHEIAHVLLQHHAEIVSKDFLYSVLTIIPILYIWAVYHNIIALILHYILEKIIDILHILPYRRIAENEADEIGLKLAAKACVDIREASVFWGNMRILFEMGIVPDDALQHPWLSTHPSFEEREQNINQKMSKALEFRNATGCPELPWQNPMDEFYSRTQRDHENYFKQRRLITK